MTELRDYRGRHRSVSVQLRFWSKVDEAPVDMCWEWIAAIGKTSTYPRFKLNNYLTTAHRAAWILSYGAIPSGLVVRHKCDNPRCCNPQHLELGTHADNVRDMITRGRRKVSSAKGTRNSKAKLNDDLVREIRSIYTSGNASTIKLARNYGVSQSLISQIVLHRIWKHV